MFWASLLATMSLIYQTMLRDLIPNYIISTHTAQISHLSNLLNFRWNVQDKGFRPWVQQRPWSFLHFICWAIHVTSGSWMLLGRSLNSGNFETFFSPLLFKVVAGWLVSVQVEGDWGWLSSEVSCLVSVLVTMTRVCVSEEATSGAWSTVQGGSSVAHKPSP
jgi:hypothetical protein